MDPNFVKIIFPFTSFANPYTLSFRDTTSHFPNSKSAVPKWHFVVISITTISPILSSFTFTTTSSYLQLSSATTATITHSKSVFATKSVLLRMTFTVDIDGS